MVSIAEGIRDLIDRLGAPNCLDRIDTALVRWLCR